MNKDRLIKSFIDLVNKDCESFNERSIADYIFDYLDRLGINVNEDMAGDRIGGNAGNLYAYLEGDLPGNPIMFSAHMDTVKPGIGKKAVIQDNGDIVSEGDTVLGADDLSGVASILEAVRSIVEDEVPHRSIEILFTVAEEVYIRGSNELNYSKIRSKQAYVFDLSGPVGTAAVKSPTLVSFEAVFRGRTAHAGFTPELGIHAIIPAAKAVSQIKMGRVDDDMTVNVGVINGGIAKNIVPDSCFISGEVRSLDHQKAEEQAIEIKNICKRAARRYEAVLEFRTSYGCLAYDTPVDHDICRKFEDVCNELGIECSFVSTLGGSDQNNFAQNGIEGIVIASGMNNVHSVNEYSNTEELFRSARIAYELMRR